MCSRSLDSFPWDLRLTTIATKPSVQYETKHPVFPVLQDIGREITQKVKPKAVVVFSGHWEGSADTIEVNTAEHTNLIYE